MPRAPPINRPALSRTPSWSLRRLSYAAMRSDAEKDSGIREYGDPDVKNIAVW